MNAIFDVTSLIFLGVAVFLIWKLYTVLGSRTGNERPPADPFSPRPQAPRQGTADVIRLPGATARTEPPDDQPQNVDEAIDRMVPVGTALNEALRVIASQDRSFDPEHFISGARVAYEMVVTAFAQGDRATLKSLLSPEVLAGFTAAIDDRQRRGETMKSDFIGLDRVEIVEASLKGNISQITVRFVSKLVSATLSADGKVVDGDPTRVLEVTDVWTFAREVRARDPNWKLVATGVDG